MSSRTIIAGVLLALTAGALALLNVWGGPDDVSKRLAEWQVSISLPVALEVTSSELRDLGGVQVHFLVAKANGRMLRLQRTDGLDAPGAQAYMQEERRRIAHVFEPTASPYFMNLTKERRCPDEYKPVFAELVGPTWKGVSIVMYANERLTYGVCTPESARLKLMLGYVYCSTSAAMFTLEYFVPVDAVTTEDSTVMAGFRCE